MTEPTTDPERPEREIVFQGRTLWVRFPKPEQILVWRRTLAQLQNAENLEWTGEKVLQALERTRKIIDSLLVNRIDVEWLDDQMLDGSIGLVDTATLITSAMQAFQNDDTNREARRATAKTSAKKAVRKAPARTNK